MAKWTKIQYPIHGELVWIVDENNDVNLATFDGDRWLEPDGSSLYYTVIAWAEVDYETIKKEWRSSLID